MMPRFLDLMELDFFLVALPYTLLDTDVLDSEFPRCTERGVGFVIGAPFASGILATGAVPGARYRYADATPEILAKVKRIEAVCGRHAVPLPAAALQFPLGHPRRRVGDPWRVIAGARGPQRGGVPPRYPGGFLGRVEARGAAAGGRAGALSGLFRGLCHCFLLPGVQHGEHLLGVKFQATLGEIVGNAAEAE